MAGKQGAGRLNCRAGFRCAVLPAKEAKGGIIQRLYAKRDPIDPCLRKTAKPPCLDRCRVGFQRDFQIGRAGKLGFRAFDQGGNRLRFHEGRRAAAKEDRLQPSLWVVLLVRCQGCFQFPQ